MSAIRSVVMIASIALFSAGASATQTVDIKPDQQAAVRIARSGPNMIRMGNGLRMAEVSGLDTQVAIAKNDKLGQAIITPKVGEPFSVFVTDDAGDTYTLLLIPTEGAAAETIVLQPTGARPGAREAEEAERHKQRIKRAIATLAEGGSLAGYRESASRKVIPLWKETLFEKQRSLMGADERIDEYRLVNTSDKELVVDEREFRVDALGGRSIIAVGIRQLALPPARNTTVWIVRRAR